ncbi:Exonuclease VII small subunit [Chloroherpeton thalassium ATCC 35110]|uniref:Exodeoxyribonuclease 7 small subunit n=1 Tax=Chloroherpeton thalassium (strain ATCC 35110 / GB-78) TaxID=517418 RepID=B3QXZ9_CHLT3|nr:exodeoxyribonuclease VII small subunit [Chloroherpeton thalassium]ACF13527.1 Exonuclease VII small subunit [Chloroherpeton thalassium ATCC 35110]
MAIKKSKESEKTLEELIARLEAIANQIQDGEAGLEKSIELYEEGQAIAQECTKRLNAAQKKLETINPNLIEPKPQSRPYQDLPGDENETLFA